MASSDMPEGRWESAEARGSGCEGLNDSLGPEILALLTGVQQTELSGHEKVTSGVVGSLRVSYLRWGWLKGTLPSEDGMVGASGA